MEKNMSESQPRERWCINLDWHLENDCSLSTLAQSYLCTKCRNKFTRDTEASKVVQNIANCCAQSRDFFDRNASVLATVFRIFLANGNNPLHVEELAHELAKRRGEYNPTISPQVLERLIRNDRYYGLRPVP